MYDSTCKTQDCFVFNWFFFNLLFISNIYSQQFKLLKGEYKKKKTIKR